MEVIDRELWGSQIDFGCKIRLMDGLTPTAGSKEYGIDLPETMISDMRGKEFELILSSVFEDNFNQEWERCIGYARFGRKGQIEVVTDGHLWILTPSMVELAESDDYAVVNEDIGVLFGRIKEE